MALAVILSKQVLVPYKLHENQKYVIIHIGTYLCTPISLVKAMFIYEIRIIR
jgi:hypothetical protein